MTTGFEHQNPATNFTIPKSHATPHAGEKIGKRVKAKLEPKSKD